MRIHGLVSRPEPTRLTLALFPPDYAAPQDPAPSTAPHAPEYD